MDNTLIPLINEPSLPAELRPEYADAVMPGFIQGIDYLHAKYECMRRIKGDGNCFYRAFLFAFLEQLLRLNCSPIETDKQHAIAELERVKSIIKNSKFELTTQGYSEFAIESFYDMLLELLDDLFSLQLSSLLDHFQANGSADYYTWYMRLLTAGYMRRHPEKFLPFLPQSDGTYLVAGEEAEWIRNYCAREVEPMGKEVEQPEVIALCEYLGVQTRIEYLDGRYSTCSQV